METSDHFRLLSLPREIRDAIYLATIHTPRDPPDSPDEAGPRFKSGCATMWNRTVYYPIGPSSWPSHVSLILCNRQVRSETLEILNRESSRLTCRLDCMQRSIDLWPTWISYPGLPQTIDHLEMNLRLFNVYRGTGLFGGDGGPGLIFAPLFALLNRFIHHGPQFMYTGPLRHPPRLETLMINISYEGRTKFDHELSDHERTPHRLNIFRVIAGMLYRVAGKGLLVGKIQRIGVRWEDHESVFETGTFEPSEEVDEEWNQYGFHWGCDPSLTSSLNT
ncbi:MAG: hypothetical protein HETSPECPRED_007104 [Heterodermia speciosa]|uniref:F-box domain-containing protein n=1 Tax=Heterodermia speciosa TaxID=116794 RepID=A0A8H3ER02_9LECA|nr:MAG: hypothetical protein HETSPECPRED_007104 [Heterodermia speciosa]